jgi:phosphohistidine phosphatase SixA
MRDRVRGETRDLMLAGHFPHLPRLLELLVGSGGAAPFPANGVVALVTKDEGATWRELWRIDG